MLSLFWQALWFLYNLVRARYHCNKWKRLADAVSAGHHKQRNSIDSTENCNKVYCEILTLIFDNLNGSPYNYNKFTKIITFYYLALNIITHEFT